MNKYVINILNNEKNVATSKAKDDIARFLEEDNYEVIELVKFKNRLEKFSHSKKVIYSKFNNLVEGDTLVIQYPTYLGYRFENKLIDFLVKRKVNIIIVIHDIDALRFENKRQPSLSKEIEELNRVNCVITSNSVMDKLLKDNGLIVPTVILGIFDYFHKEKISENLDYARNLNFAGNLNKSEFIYDYPDNNIKLDTFGNIEDQSRIPKYINYRGVFPSDKLMNEFKSGFGLVWDGESSLEIKGLYGKYLMYNNPHKLSLFLSAGMPVIIWKDAALASFVKSNKVGILVDSLSEVEINLRNVDEESYKEMAKNAVQIGNFLTHGIYIKTAIKKAQEIVSL